MTNDIKDLRLAVLIDADNVPRNSMKAIMEEAVTQIDPRIGQRVEYDGKRDGEEGNGQRAFVSLKVKGHQMGGKKYGENDDPHYATKSGKDYTAKVRYGSGTKAERTHEQGYSEAGGHRDNSGGFDSEMVVRDGVVVRNKRSVWTVNVKPTKEAHFATYPQKTMLFITHRPAVSSLCDEIIKL